MISHVFVDNNSLSGLNSQSGELASVPRQANAPHVPVATVVYKVGAGAEPWGLGAWPKTLT